jgi:hypothetical protein
MAFALVFCYIFGRRAVLKISDKRVQIINEILQGIRTIKFFNWETSYQTVVSALRKSEILVQIFLGVDAIRQHLQQLTVTEEQPPQLVRDGKDHVSMPDIQQPALCLLCCLGRTSCPTRGAKASLAGEKDTLRVTTGAPENGKAARGRSAAHHLCPPKILTAFFLKR